MAKLSGDIATNLQNQINALNEKVDDNWEKTLSDATRSLYSLSATATPDEVFATIHPLITTAQNTANQRAQILLGSYTSTGTYGQNSPNRLTFPFSPKLVVVSSVTNKAFMVATRDVIKTLCLMPSSFPAIDLTWNTNTLSWYSSSAAIYQLNEGYGAKYSYVAIG